MDYVTLPQTDLRVSRVALGTMTFGKPADEAGSMRLLARALDAGINFVDTANVYNHGLSEEIVGNALQGRRQRVILATKVCGRMGDGPDQQGLSPAAIRRAIDESLRRLRTDYLDLYYLHQPDRNVPIEESLATVDELVKEGKVRYPASSNYASWQVVEMLALAGRNGWTPAATTQPMYNLLARGIEQEYLPMCHAWKVGTVAYNPLAGGLLTGKHRREQITGGTRFDNNRLYQDRYWHGDMFDAVDAIVALAAREGRSPVSLALNWLLHHTAIDCLILGATRMDQIEANLAALEEGPLSENAVRTCDVIWQALRGPVPKYNR